MRFDDEPSFGDGKGRKRDNFCEQARSDATRIDDDVDLHCDEAENGY